MAPLASLVYTQDALVLRMRALLVLKTTTTVAATICKSSAMKICFGSKYFSPDVPLLVFLLVLKWEDSRKKKVWCFFFLLLYADGKWTACSPAGVMSTELGMRPGMSQEPSYFWWTWLSLLTVPLLVNCNSWYALKGLKNASGWVYLGTNPHSCLATYTFFFMCMFSFLRFGAVQS